MFGEMLDTSPEARAVYFRRLAAMTPQERLAIASRLSRSVRRLAEAGIRDAKPGLTEAEVRHELAVRLYGPAVAAKYFPPA